MIFCIHDEVCVKIVCSEKELLNLKDLKLALKTDFARPGHKYCYMWHGMRKQDLCAQTVPIHIAISFIEVCKLKIDNINGKCQN